MTGTAPRGTATRDAGSPARFVRPELRDLHAYTLEQSTTRFKLDQNEVPWDLPSRLKRQAAERLLGLDWAAYPDFHADGLRSALGARHGVEQDNVLVGNGSNELLGICLEALCRPGDEVLGCLPSFGLYEMFVRRAAARSRFLAPRPDLALQVPELLDEIRRDPTRPVLLCSPNNPTGAAASSEEVEELLEALEAPLLLDNAYGEFCRWDYRPLLARHSNLILFRTFSKAWSLGGMRLGYLLAHAELVRELIKVKLPYNLSHPGSVVGRVVLENAWIAERRIRVLLGRRDQWRAMLLELGLDVPASEGNFLLVGTRSLEARCPSAQPLVERLRRDLAAAGVLVRDVSRYPGLEGCFRVAVGDGRALRAARGALESALAFTEERSVSHA